MSETCLELLVLHLSPSVAEPVGKLEGNAKYQETLALVKRQPGLRAMRVGRLQENLNDIYWLIGASSCLRQRSY
jgi:hypothetical protein